MFLSENARPIASLLASAALLFSLGSVAKAELPMLGMAIDESALADFDHIILPDGSNLPAGAGSAVQGATVYNQQCAACHGAEGEGGAGVPAVAGGIGSLATATPLLTVGSYWPHATTVFDYVRRAMPPQAPKSLSDEEVYQVTAYLFYLNGIIEQDSVLDSVTLPQVAMPNHDGFIDRSHAF